MTVSSVSIDTENYFPGISRELELFVADEPVWQALDRLKEFIGDTIRPNIPELVEPGIPLAMHLALIDGQWLSQGFRVECGAGTRGRFVVLQDDEPVKDAVLICAGAVFTDRQAELGTGVVVEPGALVKGPVIVGSNTEVRQGAYLRGDCLVGKRCVVGHTTEMKHSIFLDDSKAGHFAYVGDSILGRDVNMGAGTKLANLRFGPGSVAVMVDGRRIDTGRRKIGAILGDEVQTGCNSVTNPGSIVGRSSLIAPNTAVAPGVYAARSVIR